MNSWAAVRGRCANLSARYLRGGFPPRALKTLWKRVWAKQITSPGREGSGHRGSSSASAPNGVSPQALWDGLPEAAKWQIILTVGFFEFWRENSYILSSEGEAHYMRGGKPGYFPTFAQLPHPVPFDLFDPFGLQSGLSPEKKAKSLLAEVNNGRLAMLGMMSFLAESQVPGSVPGLTGIGLRPYDGNVMIPFEGDFSYFS